MNLEHLFERVFSGKSRTLSRRRFLQTSIGISSTIVGNALLEGCVPQAAPSYAPVTDTPVPGVALSCEGQVIVDQAYINQLLTYNNTHPTTPIHATFVIEDENTHNILTSLDIPTYSQSSVFWTYPRTFFNNDRTGYYSVYDVHIYNQAYPQAQGLYSNYCGTPIRIGVNSNQYLNMGMSY